MYALAQKTLDALVNNMDDYDSPNHYPHGYYKRRQDSLKLEPQNVRDPHMIIIRNKYTKEIIDPEVSSIVVFILIYFLPASELNRYQVF